METGFAAEDAFPESGQGCWRNNLSPEANAYITEVELLAKEKNRLPRFTIVSEGLKKRGVNKPSQGIGRHFRGICQCGFDLDE